MNNPLVRPLGCRFRLHRTAESATQDRLRGELFSSGVAADILARWVAVLDTHATDLVDQSTIDSESQRLQELIDAA